MTTQAVQDKLTQWQSERSAQECHLLRPEFLGIPGIRGAYSKLRLLPTSTNADVFLIRSHIAYWAGSREAERMTISPSRGHSYKIQAGRGEKMIVRIVDHFDHREGVVGWK